MGSGRPDGPRTDCGRSRTRGRNLPFIRIPTRCGGSGADGYTPFYISHYGRHGSRWHASESVYAGPLKILRKAAEAGALTPLGRDVLGRVEIIAADADKRYGDLSPRGVAEHRGIAERMYKAYPEVFSTADGRECPYREPLDSRAALHPQHGGFQRAAQGVESRDPDHA